MFFRRVACIASSFAVVALGASACAHSVEDATTEVDLGDSGEATDGGPSGPDGGDASGRDGSVADASGGDASPADAGSERDAVPSEDGSATDGAAFDAADGASDASDSSAACVTVAPNHKCGLVPQCGCAVNETCDVTNDTTGATSCISAGTGGVGTACTSSGSCAVGLTCAFGACRPYCTASGQTCPGGVCFDPQNAQGQSVPNLHVCSIRCDLRASSTACPGAACVYFSGENDTDCGPAGTKGQGASCDANGQDDCAAGFACVSPSLGLTNYCMRWCRLSQGNADCTGGAQCNDAFPANGPTSGGSKLGVCF